MRPRLVARLLAALACSLPLLAWACRCPPSITPAEAFSYAEMVVQARVLKVDERPEAKEWTATLQVERSWKSAAPARLEVSTGLSCAYEFTAGQPTLIYLRRDPTLGRWETRRCMGNLPLDQAAKALGWLRRRAKAIAPTP